MPLKVIQNRASLDSLWPIPESIPELNVKGEYLGDFALAQQNAVACPSQLYFDWTFWAALRMRFVHRKRHLEGAYRDDHRSSWNGRC
jgi:hypothetical protein